MHHFSDDRVCAQGCGHVWLQLKLSVSWFSRRDLSSGPLICHTLSRLILWGTGVGLGHVGTTVQGSHSLCPECDVEGKGAGPLQGILLPSVYGNARLTHPPPSNLKGGRGVICSLPVLTGGAGGQKSRLTPAPWGDFKAFLPEGAALVCCWRPGVAHSPLMSFQPGRASSGWPQPGEGVCEPRSGLVTPARASTRGWLDWEEGEQMST